MRTLIVYYSFTGNTKHLAMELAAEESADLLRLLDLKKPGKLKAYLMGCPAAIFGKAWPIQTLDVDLAAYERVVLMSPVWAGNVVPAVNAFLQALPAGLTLEVKLVSASGQSKCADQLGNALHTRDCTLAGIEDIRMR